jgi:2-iminobutanoate/2-iminopropanoate deaminase
MVADHSRCEDQGQLRCTVTAPLQYISPEGSFKGDVPLSLAVKVGKFVFISGIPAFDPSGKIAAGNFAAQMVQIMENIARILKEAGCGWDRVVRTKILLTRQADFTEMNRIYASYFPGGQFPARTTLYVQALPQPDFLVEVECEAMLP